MNKLKIVGYVFLGIIIIVLLWGLSFGFKWATLPFIGKIEQREQIMGSGEFRIFSYNHFFNLCQSIQQVESQYDNQYDLLQEMEKGTESYERQQRNVAVLCAEIERRKHRYNADSAKEETVSAFMQSNLPGRIEIETHKYGNRTNCNY
jgi:hypothetical protein